MSDTLGGGFDDVRSVARGLDGRFKKRDTDAATALPYIVWEYESTVVPLARDVVELGVRATLTKHLGNLDESPPLFVEALAAVEATE